MTWIIDTKSRRPLSAKLTAGIAISALLALGTFTAPTSARDRDGEYHHNWNGGYYRAPPVVYGSSYGSSYYGYGYSPYYYAPPVVYGPGIGLPGINIGIR
jgi:hypothetical protein